MAVDLDAFSDVQNYNKKKLTFRPIECLGINVGAMYVAGLGEDDASYTSTDVLTGQPTTFTANYKVHSFVASLGVSLKF